MRSVHLACSHPMGGFDVWTLLLVMMLFKLSQSGHNDSRFSANRRIYWNESPNIQALLVKYRYLLQSQTQKIVWPDTELIELNETKLKAWVSTYEQLITKCAWTQGKFENSPFRMQLMGQILIKLDTSVVVSYINEEADKRNRNLLEESIWLFLWAELHLAFVRVCHFPDLRSMLADYFNRLGCSFGRAWSLDRYIIHCSKTKVKNSSEQTLLPYEEYPKAIQICNSHSEKQTKYYYIKMPDIQMFYKT